MFVRSVANDPAYGIWVLGGSVVAYTAAYAAIVKGSRRLSPLVYKYKRLCRVCVSYVFVLNFRLPQLLVIMSPAICS